MSNYRRCYVPGGMYFLTLVSYKRRKILTTDAGRKILRGAIERTRGKSLSFNLFATVLLPDHWLLVMELPNRDQGFSTRIRRIKEQFSRSWLESGYREANVTVSQRKRNERGIWQPRFWEHLIGDSDDLIACVDYIHWNPRKHGLVRRVRDWPRSSFHRFVKSGDYDINDINWGGTIPSAIRDRVDLNWGE